MNARETEHTASAGAAPIEDDALTAEILKEWPDFPPARGPMLLAMCAKYGVNPDPSANPRELLAIKGGGDPRFLEGDFVVIVTAGGVKLREPMDQRTEEKLRLLHKAFRHERDPRTKEERTVNLPLPKDLRLQPQHRHGIPPERRG